jgi:hypothetical protein
MLKWLSNTYEPDRNDHGEMHKEHAARMAWLEGKIIGAPKATETYTVDELRAMHMVGVYVMEPESEKAEGEQ